MYRKSNTELVILKIDKDRQFLAYRMIRGIFLHDLRQFLYLTDDDDRLIGILSVDDVMKRLEDGRIYFNRDFSRLYEWNVIKAKKIFEENDEILEIPVLDADDRLVGAYARRDDFLEIEYGKEYISESCMAAATNNMKVPIHIVDSGYKASVNDCLNIFRKTGISCDVIRAENLEIGGGISLFVTEEEKRAYQCGYKRIEENIGYKRFDGKILENIMTVNEYLHLLYPMFGTEENAWTLRSVLDELYKRGIGVVTIYKKQGESDYCWDLQKKLAGKKMAKQSESISQWNMDMEMNTLKGIPIYQEQKNGTKYLCDVKSKYYNVCKGRRKTFYQPLKRDFSHIYFFGPCFIFGSLAKDEDTIESYLQQMINQNDVPYIVENCGVQMYWPQSRIVAENIKAGDIVVCYTRELYFDDYPAINLWDIYEKYNFPVEYFVDDVEHFNAVVHKACAETIYNIICNMEVPPAVNNSSVVDLKNSIIADRYLTRYFADVFDMIQKNPDMKIGSIVMNANPFTLGHRYLVEQAMSRVDYLIIFVVEEDLSTFSFYERWWMVKKGTEDMGNVKVVPSGNFVLSQETFPDYFVKETTPDIKEQTEYDIALFADAIAGPLGIRYRFMGEEPTDAVTRQYNEAMKKILPFKGIKVEEIRRKEIISSESVISASTVRKLLEKGDTEKLAAFLPETTMQYLI